MESRRRLRKCSTHSQLSIDTACGLIGRRNFEKKMTAGQEKLVGVKARMGRKKEKISRRRKVRVSMGVSVSIGFCCVMYS